MTKPILEMRGISKSYPGVAALTAVDLVVERGEVHGLMGENGAGKSTLIKVLAGAIKPDVGTIAYDGESFPYLDPRHALKLGIGVIYQEFNLVGYLSIAENIALGQEETFGPFLKSRQMVAKTGELLRSLGIDLDPRMPVRELTVAYQQMVEIAKAVSRNVKLLVMDEPTAPLSGREADTLFALIARLKAKGISIIYISHRLEEIFALTDRITVIRDGRFVMTTPTRLTDRKSLVSAMVGRALNETYPDGKHATRRKVLEVCNLSSDDVDDISFHLFEGEILGIGGLVGAGRTELVRAIFGADQVRSGAIAIDGVGCAIASPLDAIRQGIGLIPEDRKQQGLLLNMSVKENVTLASMNRFLRFRLVHETRERSVVSKYIEQLRIKTPKMEQRVKVLSGGNQQKVVLAKWLETNAKILIFDEPTRGIDVGAKHEIYELMRELTRQGISILMISSDMPELLGMADRILVMSRGRIVGELATPATQDQVMELAAS
ncbi:sugar ABC transporter ATP-binding protein [Shinella daejeonensis]|uniref:sugar ABC transporter ATP-binding protein n=1 Tax=Shinella daejeonensis TaxID=659017 RepID=UPI0020C7AF80|nr:sugar ABC transporter ATP-binding protein [Shinella daejeonensis]MCP8894576.1 sugar ABC transporter ATP-binding protein [Shinella daejeonensis]